MQLPLAERSPALIKLTLGFMGASAQGFSQSVADVAGSPGVVHRGCLLRITQRHLALWFGV